MAQNVILNRLQAVFLVASVVFFMIFGFFGCLFAITKIGLDHSDVVGVKVIQSFSNPSLQRDVQPVLGGFVAIWAFCFLVAVIVGVLITVISLWEIFHTCVNGIAEWVKETMARINELQAEHNAAGEN